MVIIILVVTRADSAKEVIGFIIQVNVIGFIPEHLLSARDCFDIEPRVVVSYCLRAIRELIITHITVRVVRQISDVGLGWPETGVDMIEVRRNANII